MVRIGLIIKIMTLAVAISAQPAEKAVAPKYGHDAKMEALRWATDALPRAADAVLPNALNERIRFPICRVTTLRALGSNDSLDYLIRFAEDCDHRVEAAVTLPVGDSITNQLARIRLSDHNVGVDIALGRIRTRRISLSTSVATALALRLAHVTTPALATTELYFDVRKVEVASNAGGARTRFDLFDVQNAPAGAAEIIGVVHDALKAAGMTNRQLRLDATYWSNDD